MVRGSELADVMSSRLKESSLIGSYPKAGPMRWLDETNVISQSVCFLSWCPCSALLRA